MVHLEARGLGVQSRVQVCVEREQTSSVQRGREVGAVAGHAELHVAPRLVQEVAQRRAGDDVGAGWAAGAHGGADVGDGGIERERLVV